MYASFFFFFTKFLSMNSCKIELCTAETSNTIHHRVLKKKFFLKVKNYKNSLKDSCASNSHLFQVITFYKL